MYEKRSVTQRKPRIIKKLLYLKNTKRIKENYTILHLKKRIFTFHYMTYTSILSLTRSLSEEKWTRRIFSARKFRAITCTIFRSNQSGWKNTPQMCPNDFLNRLLKE